MVGPSWRNCKAGFRGERGWATAKVEGRERSGVGLEFRAERNGEGIGVGRWPLGLGAGLQVSGLHFCSVL